MQMEKMRLGRTNILASRTAFGALPIQRTEQGLAVKILQKAYDGGIDFFDTARGYSDSEEKLGLALSAVRKSITIATKSHAANSEALQEHCETSLRLLKTDYIDIYQLHNPAIVPALGSDLYEGMLKLKQSGKIRFISITCHRLDNAMKAVESGLYDTVQFPLSYLSSDADLALAAACREHDVGLIAMKALSGGLITSAEAASAFLRQYENVLPIWGIQHESELDQFLALAQSPKELTGELQSIIDRDKQELSGAFCRGCGYCQPCPAGISIFTAARISLLLRRAPYKQFLTAEWQETMEKIEDCTGCGHCKRHCPYGLDTPELLRANLKDYREFVQAHKEN
jgi:uncharacterized protein